jgi:hypothetical protein
MRQLHYLWTRTEIPYCLTSKVILSLGLIVGYNSSAYFRRELRRSNVTDGDLRDLGIIS